MKERHPGAIAPGCLSAYTKKCTGILAPGRAHGQSLALSSELDKLFIF